MNKIFSTLLLSASLSLLGSNICAQTEGPRELKRCSLNESQVASIQRKAPENASYQTQLVGFLYYADSWNDLEGTTPMGIYTVDTKPGSMPQPFARIGAMNSHCNGGAVLVGDTFWYIWRQTAESDEQTIDISQLYSYNIVTGEFGNHGMVSSTLASTNDHAWDPTEDKIYGQYTVDGTRKLCVVDYLNQEITPVGDCYNYYGLAFDATGQLWGIDNGGILYKVNKTSGAATRVGSTGITPRYAQSMAFDLKTGDLYWASMIDGDVRNCSKLYRIDTATATPTLITAFQDSEEFMGLGVMPPVAADNAPGYATGLSVTMDLAATSGSVTFTLPEYTYIGNPLDGEIQYRVMANDQTLLTGNAQKGTTVSHDITLPNGEVTISVICSNSEGDGPAASISRWVGEDYPLAPANVRLSIDESTGKASLSWNAVTEGVHGGYINPGKVSYTITRMPDNQIVAEKQSGTAFEETLTEPELPVDYYYEVKALHDWRESETAASNHVPFGKGFNVPYRNSFDDAASMDLFKKIDGNSDGRTWEWDSHKTKTAYIFTGTDVGGNQDDWLITPGIDMKAGSRYEVKYTVCANLNDGRFLDRMEVKYGKGVEPSTYSLAEAAFESIGQTVEHRFEITPEEDGYYHIGFHAISNCKAGLSISIDDLNIDALADPLAPAAVEGLTVKTSQGTAPVTLRFTTPTKTVSGQNLDKITKIDVYRNTSELVKTIESTSPGRLTTVVDNKGAKGITEYTVVAYNEYGVGERAKISTYLGLDLPGAPRNILLTDAGNGKLKLAWETPEAGANGGYCDPSNLTYNIYAVANGYAVEFKNGIRGNEIEFIDQDYYAAEQFPKYYGISASNSAGEGSIYRSSEVMVGQPYSYPFNESWKSGNATHDGWYRMSNGEKGWEPAANYSSDNDNGCMAFEAFKDGDLSYLALGKVNVAYASNPKLIFDYYAVPGADMYLLPEINLAYNGNYSTADVIQFASLGGESGWRKVVLDIAPYTQDRTYISVRFLGKGSALYPLRIDNVRVMDSDETPNSGFSGLGEITSDCDGPVKYYDINGLEVTNPQKGSIYIVRSASGKVFKTVW